MELALRFLVGGAVVSLFAALSDAFYPKVFAGLLGSAPSVALASLGLTVFFDGADKASVEARSMILGAAAFLIYAWAARQILSHSHRSAHLVTTFSLVIWLVAALSLRRLFP